MIRFCSAKRKWRGSPLISRCRTACLGWATAALSAGERRTELRIPLTKNRKNPLDYDRAIYKTRHKIENLFAKLKDWRRIATRYDRCSHTFFSAICIAAVVAFYPIESEV
ncbi:hypothetical protein DSM21852_26050 [Methylocystis bryophila]|nr:hypothetical protein DSM21852_26050 [Methylocystis bryophila]